jgi:hypothetical protein
MESKYMSFKLSSPVKKIGTLIQDRISGVYGRIGKVCNMIPMSVKIRNKLQSSERTFRVEMMDHSFFTVRLCAIAIYNVLDAQEATLGNNTVWFKSKIFMEGEAEPFVWSDMYTHQLFISGNFFEPLLYLYRNPFKRPQIQKIEVEFEISHRLQHAYIASAHVDSTEVQTGETLTLRVGLLPQQQKQETVSIPITIPETLPEGTYPLSIFSGSMVKQSPFTPENHTEYLQYLKSLNTYKNNQVVVVLALPACKVLCQGYHLDNLPPTVIGNLLPTNQTKDIQLASSPYIVTQETPYHISGIMHIYITVKRK